MSTAPWMQPEPGDVCVDSRGRERTVLSVADLGARGRRVAFEVPLADNPARSRIVTCDLQSWIGVCAKVVKLGGKYRRREEPS